MWWDANGYCLLSKRLHRAFFAVPVASEGQKAVRIDAGALAQLLAGVTREQKKRRDLH